MSYDKTRLSPSEEAKRLIDLFYVHTYRATIKPYSTGDARTCAIKCVSEIMKNNRVVGLPEAANDYWLEVIEEIQALEETNSLNKITTYGH